MFDSIETKTIGAGLLSKPHEPLSGLIAHVTPVTTAPMFSVQIANIGAKLLFADISCRVWMIGIGMEIPPVLGPPAAFHTGETGITKLLEFVSRSVVV